MRGESAVSGRNAVRIRYRYRFRGRGTTRRQGLGDAATVNEAATDGATVPDAVAMAAGTENHKARLETCTMDGMTDPKSSLLSYVFNEYLPRLKHPWLFFILLVLFLVDLVIPDFIPFVDEAMFGLLTVLVGAWKNRKESAEPPKDVTDRGSDGPA